MPAKSKKKEVIEGVTKGKRRQKRVGENATSLRSKKVKVKVIDKKKRKPDKERHQKRKYNVEDFNKAVHAVKSGMSFRKAAQMHQVPVTSVFRVVKNPEREGKIFTAPTILSADDEQEIVNWVLFRAKSGFPVIKSELLDCIQAYVFKLGKHTPFTDGRPGRHWFEGFSKRHPNLTIRTAQHLTISRAMVTEEDLREWFAEVRIYLQSKNLLNIDASRVFNCDETSIKLLPKSDKILTSKGARSTHKIVHECEKESLTALFMYSADGVRTPPMIMYKYKESIPKKILDNFPRGWGIGISENGWMTAETFYEYITNIYYPWLVTNNIQFPVVVYMDGHSSHMNIPLVSFCKQKEIELITLFPNATHIVQPLDIAVFHPFKVKWRKTVPKWKIDNNITKLKREDFASVLKETLDSFTEEKKCVQSGFRASGLMPFNPDAVDYNSLQKKMKKNDEVNQIQKNEQTDSNNLKEDKQKLLTAFEESLPDELFQLFKEAEPSKTWIYDIENLGLFNHWLRMKKACCGIYLDYSDLN